MELAFYQIDSHAPASRDWLAEVSLSNPSNETYLQLFVGTTGVGSHDVYNSDDVKVTSELVTGLPSNGQKVYIRHY